MQATSQAYKRLSLAEIEHLANSALQSHGFSADQAAAVARTVTLAERDGCRSHGLFRIPFYIAALRHPQTDARAQPNVRVTDSTVVHVDGGGGFCPLALERGLPALQDKAAKHGMGALAIHRSFNIAALWPEVEWLADQGLVAFAFTTSNAYVAPAGGSQPVFGTNPMAFAFPRQGGSPLVFDQASSVSARGEIQLYRRAGKPLPEGWAIDGNGEMTTDPEAALQGAQLPFGGYKGSSIALMVELLAGALIGDAFSVESSRSDVQNTGAPFGGELLLALNPAHFGSNDYLQRSEWLYAQILEQPGTRLPSQRRYQARKQAELEGVDVAVTQLEEIQSLLGSSKS